MDGVTPIPWRRGAHFSTGRDALCALLTDICARPAAGCAPAAAAAAARPATACAQTPDAPARPAARRLWLPGYYCPDVMRTLLSLALSLRLELRTYPAPPPGPPDPARIPLAPGDLLLLVNLFGLHGATDRRRRFAAGVLPPGVMIIEDHTHDPLSLWARTSTADWCFASLRKTLPLPDGGVVWSPGGRALPRPPALTLQRRLASLEMLAAMTLRRAWPAGGAAAPETIRELELKAEARLQSGAVSGMAPWTREMLEGLPVVEMRERRLAAQRQLGAALEAAAEGRQAGAEPPRAAEVSGVRLLRPADRPGSADGADPVPAGCRVPLPGDDRTRLEADPADACPYPAILEFARPAARERARRLLEEAGVETLVLWPVERQGLPDARAAEELDFSRRMLAVLRLEDTPPRRGPGEAAALASLLREAAAAGAAESP